MSEKKQTQETVKTKTQQPEKVIYMGPSIKKVVNQGTVFEGGIPPELEEKAKEIPSIRALIIPVKDLPKANIALATPGSALDVLYKKIDAMEQE